jgi:YidC/Oxa1 family membrane protein insertase
MYSALIYNPLLNLLVSLYNTIAFQDLGLAIIFLTILIRLILYPLFKKNAEYQRVMRVLQPKLKQAQETHKADPSRQTQEIMKLYKEHKLNPFSGFLYLLIQIPVLFGLYRIFLNIFKPNFFNGLYSFVQHPASLNPVFLGLINLGKSSIILVVLAAIAQYFQARLMLPKTIDPKNPAERMARQMMFLGPILTLAIFYSLPAAVALYWLVASLFSIVQEMILNRTRYGQLESITNNNP